MPGQRGDSEGPPGEAVNGPPYDGPLASRNHPPARAGHRAGRRSVAWVGASRRCRTQASPSRRQLLGSFGHSVHRYSNGEAVDTRPARRIAAISYLQAALLVLMVMSATVLSKGLGF